MRGLYSISPIHDLHFANTYLESGVKVEDPHPFAHAHTVKYGELHPTIDENFWRALIHEVLKKQPHEDMVIPKNAVPNPVEEGFIETIGEPRGQLKDYELTLEDGRRIHVREFKDHYKVHWDNVSLLVSPIDHLRHDAPHWWITLCAFIGAATSYMVFRRGKMLIGGLKLGLILGAATSEGIKSIKRFIR